MLTISALAGMFAAAFLAATPIPFQSEVVFAGLLAVKTASPWLLVLVASIANTLGSCVTYVVGRAIGGNTEGRFALPERQRIRAEAWFSRWGVWALLLSWLPGGDVIVAMAGAMRTSVWQFVTLVAIAKTGRYVGLVVLMAVATG